MKMKMVGKNSSDLPPGFRFHPTDEELIMYYLRNQATRRACPVSIIPEVDIYKFDPWELAEKTEEYGEKEWYFFTPRDRKYPNGVRPNRAAVSGYWKATGTDKPIHSASKYVGVKKALVFYKGKPPKGVKTNWIMHEYRLIDSSSSSSSTPTKQIGSMRLDDWVLCRIYKKKSLARVGDNVKDDGSPSTHVVVSTDEDNASSDNHHHHHHQQQPQVSLMQLPRPCSLSHLWELDYLGSSVTQLLNDNSSIYHNQTTVINNNNNNNNHGNNLLIGGGVAHHYSDAMKLQLNHQGSMLGQAFYMNPTFGLD